MESWQEAHIIKHLSDLIKMTKVNAEVLADLQTDKVLGKHDVEVLNAEGERFGDMNKATMLYNMLVTRINGYKAIGKATFKSKQSGAFCLLVKGLLVRLLKQTNIELEDEAIDKILKKENATEDMWQFFTAKLEKETLYEDTWIAAQRPLYIPRHISNRVKLNPQVFQQPCSDVFVFTGLTRSKLYKLATPNRTATSNEVINQNTSAVRFVLLEDEADWDELRSIWSQPTHLIHLDIHSSDYILHQSTQPSEVVLKYVPPHLRDKSLYVPEEQFLSDLDTEKNKRTVCICDTPGMGKTWLLENIARNVQRCYTNTLVAVISLQKYVLQMEASGLNKINSKPIHTLMQYLCPSHLTSALLEASIENNKLRLELFLDGFDEIPAEHVESSKNFFESIAEYKENIRLFVTSRPHMRHELENTFQAVAYDILPFSEENQIQFLLTYWKRYAKQPSKLLPEKLRLFAQKCLKKFKKALTQQETDMTGIPLLCYLLATVNLSNAERFCSRTYSCSVDDFISPKSLHDMYDMYFELGINRAIKNQKYFDYESEVEKERENILEGSSPSSSPEGQKLKAFHVWKALDLLIPGLATDYLQSETCISISDIEVNQVLACGLLQKRTGGSSKTALTFLHRTFAEYLVAKHFIEIFSNSSEFHKETLSKHLSEFVHYVLSTQSDRDNGTYLKLGKFVLSFEIFVFSNATLVYFLNSNLNNDNFFTTSSVVHQAFNNFLSKETLPRILSACITDSHANIIRLIKNLLKPSQNEITTKKEILRNLIVYPVELNEPISGSSPDAQHLSWFTYLCHAASKSNVRVLEELYSLFADCMHDNLDESFSHMPKLFDSPLHCALRRQDHSMVEFFIDRDIDLSNRDLLYACLGDVIWLSPECIKKAIDICEILLEKNSSLLFETHEGWSLILRVRIVEFIKFLVDKKTDIKATRRRVDYKGDWNIHTVLTINAGSMYRNEFCKLCRYIIHEAPELFVPNLPCWDDPLPKIIREVDDDTLMSILGMNGLKIGGSDRWCNNLLLLSINKKRKLNPIIRLMDLGVDIKATNCFHENALHIAVKYENFEIAEHCLSVGFSLEDKDCYQQTPLHHAWRSLDMLKYLISKNANVLAVNKTGNNIAHIALKSHNSKFTRNGVNETAMYLLTLKQAPEIFKMVNKLGWTPLREWLASSNPPPHPGTKELILQICVEK